MRAVFKIDEKQINNMELDITIRMTVTEWKQLQSEQSDVHPSSVVGLYITRALRHITHAVDNVIIEPAHAADPVEK